MRPDITTQPSDDICPAGGQHEPIRISYGYPSGEMIEAYERGEISLGGCEVSPASPTSRCRRCGAEATTEGGPALAGLTGITFAEEQVIQQKNGAQEASPFD